MIGAPRSLEIDMPDSMAAPRSDERQRFLDLDFSSIAFSLVLLHTRVLAGAAGTSAAASSASSALPGYLARPTNNSGA